MKKHLGQTPSVREYTERLAPVATESCAIDPALYEEYGVKRGLRDKSGKGVLAGLTNISDIVSSKTVGGETVPCEGELYYRGYDINSLIGGILKDNRFGFEEIAYLLLMGDLPDKAQLAEFKSVLSGLGTLPTNFVRDVVMKAPSGDMMNTLARSVLTLASYDADAASLDYANVLRQCLALISVFPMLAVYGYHAYNHYVCDDSFYIHRPDRSLSMAENILRMLRPDRKYSDLEAKVLDIALILHMEHGGGNNSTFTCRTLTSSGTDAYSAYAGAIGSLKGHRHGGANFKVIAQLEEFKSNIQHWDNDAEVADYLSKIIRKEKGDGTGLIYGMGHAVYTLSDPRAVILKRNAMELAKGTEFEKEFMLLDAVERLTPEVFAEVKGNAKVMCANVDLYSGLVYRMLKIPVELNTPMFAVSRIVGWSAHRIEELVTGNRIIRPAYKAINKKRDYLPIELRD